MKKIGLIVSTTEAQLLGNQAFVDQLNAVKVPVVVVNQYQYHRIPENAFSADVHVIQTRIWGLSKSRNLALEALPCEYAMLCDDDITLQPGWLEDLMPNLQSGNALIFTPLFTTTGRPWRTQYAAHSFAIQGLSFANRRRIQKINSMEQIVSKSYLIEHKLAFNTEFGKGSNRYVMGEDTLLSFDILRTGGSIIFLPIPTRIHPPISSGTHENCSNFLAIAAIHRKVFYPFGRVIFLLFFLKKLLQRWGSK